MFTCRICRAQLLGLVLAHVEDGVEVYTCNKQVCAGAMVHRTQNRHFEPVIVGSPELRYVPPPEDAW